MVALAVFGAAPFVFCRFELRNPQSLLVKVSSANYPNGSAVKAVQRKGCFFDPSYYFQVTVPANQWRPTGFSEGETVEAEEFIKTAVANFGVKCVNDDVRSILHQEGAGSDEWIVILKNRNEIHDFVFVE